MSQVSGIDGIQELGVLEQTLCCAPDLCEIELCALACNFINLLPAGPLWDAAKADALHAVSKCINPNEIVIPCSEEGVGCTSLVAHSIYSAHKLYDLITQALAPAVYESNPYTAYRTLDDWLVRLGWENCFETACRSPLLGPITPLESLGPCGPEYCPPAYPDELILAVKRGVVVALSRLNLGIIKNKANINFVIQSLGAKIGEIPVSEERTCCDIQIGVIPVSDTIKKANPYYCRRNELAAQFKVDQDIQAYVLPGGECNPNTYSGMLVSMPEKIYPGVLAAECIVRSILTNSSACHKISFSCAAV